MEEKTIPWWRKALKIALGGIRSGFGLFSRSRKPEAAAEPEIPEKSAESRNEEPVLTESLPQPEILQPEIVAAAPSIPDEPVAETAVVTEPALIAALEVAPEVPEAVRPEAKAESAVESAVEPVDWIPEPVSEPAAAIEPEAIEAAPGLETIEAVTEIEAEAKEEAIPELAEVAEPAAEVEPVSESEAEQPIEPIPEAVVTDAAEPEIEPEPEVALEPETVIVPKAQREAEIDVEAVPEPLAIAEPESEPETEEEPIAAALELVEIIEVITEIEPEAAAEPFIETVVEPKDSVAVTELPPVVEPEPEAESPATEIEAVAPVAESPVEPDNSFTEPVAAPVAESQAARELAEPLPEAEPESAAEPWPDESQPNQESIVIAATDSQPEFPVATEPETKNEVTDDPQTEPSETILVENAPIETAPVEAAIEIEAEALPASAAVPEADVVAPGVAAGEVHPPLVLTPEPTVEELANAKAEERVAAKLAARQKRLDEGSEQSPFSIVVGQVYDGPLDLLLDLIRKQDIDIYDIPIAKITAQFLAYVNQLKSGDVDVAGEFIYTASLLIHIKSKMLLPRATTGPDDAAEDPRRELVERLLEHERFKSAAQMLQQKQMLEAATWTNPGVREFKDDAAAEPEIAADTVDLVRIFRDILERARKRPVFSVDEESVTVGQMIQFLGRRLTMEDKPIALRRLLSHTRSERALIAMFLALLELVRMQAILLRQDKLFSEIFIKKHTGFDAVMNEGLINAQDDWR